MAPQRVFLGQYVNLAKNQITGDVVYDVKEEVRAGTVDKIQHVMDSGYLSPGEASSLRGKLGWQATGTWGKCGRLGQLARSNVPIPFNYMQLVSSQ